MSIRVIEASLLSGSARGREVLHREYHHDPTLASHPIISVYGKTLEGSFPLILVVGREPNDSLVMGNELGPYEFPGIGANSVPFWDLAYSLVAESRGMKGMELKRLCMERRSSPIAFADISSNPILSREIDKEKPRRKLTTEDYIAHLQKVASKGIFPRVRLAIFTGLTYPPWAESKYGGALREIESEWDKEFVEVRFLYGGNMKAVKAAFSAHEATAKDILEDWMA
jgi:hypothetical protein